MEPAHWDQVMAQASEQMNALLEINSDGMHEAMKKGKGTIAINMSLTITSESSYSADLKSSISYVIERVKDGGSKRVLFGQENLPLPDETVTAKKRAAKSGAGIVLPAER